MKQMIQPLLLASLVVFIISCSKKDTPPPSTSLKITVEDGVSPAGGATVTLYASQQDLLTGTGALSTRLIEASGVALFTGLSPQKYYFKAEKSCKNNLNGVVSSATALGKGILNTAVVKITPTGTLRLTNTSSHPYDVYANGVLLIDNMQGGSSKEFTEVPAGNWQVRVVQQSGYAFTPTEKTYYGLLSCGSTLKTSFPQ